MNKKIAFTLAETLITIGIIGVVAAITIPNLIKNYQKSQIELSLKRSYSIMTQALKMSIAENGDIDGWKLPQNDTADECHDFVKTYIFPYMKVINDCGVEQGCFGNPEYLMNGSIAENINDTKGKTIKFTTIDGINIAVYTSGTSNTIHIYFDVNGNKKPNTRGKDIFEFIIPVFTEQNNTEHILLPNGYYDNTNDCKTNNSGFVCAKLIFNNNWKFPKDYPW
ncbi:type II secretion system protein [bacterium]|nr:type II secretion system protein [bacterium]